MKTPRNPDRLIRTYLQEDQASEYHEVPDRLYNAIRDGIEQTRQRAVIGSVGVPDMNKFLAVGLGAAAVVAVLLIGSNLLGSSSPPPGGQPSDTPGPSVAAEPSTAPSGFFPFNREIPEGSYLLWDQAANGWAVPITVSLPGPGWWGERGVGVIMRDNNPFPPDGADMDVFPGADTYWVYGDPCRWQTTKPDAPADTVGELVAALQGQASSSPSAPTDITVGGYAGTSITLRVPDDVDISQCDDGDFGSFTVNDEQSPSRYFQAPGQIEEMWVVDVNGEVVLLEIGHYAETPQAVVDELRAIMASATFE